MVSLVEIGAVVLEKMLKRWKVYSQTDRQAKGRQTTCDLFTWTFSLVELKTHNQTEQKQKSAYSELMIRVREYLMYDTILVDIRTLP